MLITDELVERVAKAMQVKDSEPRDDSDCWPLWKQYVHEARAALSIAAKEITEACAKVATDFRVSDSRAPHKNIRDGIASAIRALAREG